MAYDKYIALGGKDDGKLFPRSEFGLDEARKTDSIFIRPAELTTEEDADSWEDWNDYGCNIDRGNSRAYIKP